MKKYLAMALALLLALPLLTSCAGGSDGVVIFSSMENYRNEELTRQLNEALPNIDVTVQQISTGNNAAKIQAEGTKTEADIVLGLETASYQKIIDNFASLESFDQPNYLDEFRYPDSRAVYWDRYEGGILVNTVELEKLGLPEPKSYQDLLDPQYKGLIVMPNPKTSGTGYMFLNMWVNMMGEDEAFAYVDKLAENVKQFSESGSGPVQMLNQGEAVIGLGMLFQAVEQINQGSPIKVIVPEEGCPYNTTLTGIISGREKDENVRQVFEYLMNSFFIYDKEYYMPGEIVHDQQLKLENYPTNVVSGDMSTITDSELKTRLLDRWKY